MKWRRDLIARALLVMSLIFFVAGTAAPRYGAAWWANLAAAALDAFFLTFLTGPPIPIVPSDAQIRRILSQMVSEHYAEWIRQWRQSNPPH